MHFLNFNQQTDFLRDYLDPRVSKEDLIKKWKYDYSQIIESVPQLREELDEIIEYVLDSFDFYERKLHVPENITKENIPDIEDSYLDIESFEEVPILYHQPPLFWYLAEKKTAKEIDMAIDEDRAILYNDNLYLRDEDYHKDIDYLNLN